MVCTWVFLYQTIKVVIAISIGSFGRFSSSSGAAMQCQVPAAAHKALR
jgi:hypothetical protein